MLLCSADQLSRQSANIVEGRLPIIQSLDGPQLENRWTIKWVANGVLKEVLIAIAVWTGLQRDRSD
jgi:hypothetical protein